MGRIIYALLALTIVQMAEAQDNIEIATVEKLTQVATNVNNGTTDYAGKTIKLAADLDLSGVAWTPVGTTGHPFAGTFDGQGHTVSNLNVSIDSATSGGVAGLFGKISASGIVKDVHVAGGTIDITTNANGYTCYLGSIAGINEGTIVGCSNTARVLGSSWMSARVGGLVGENDTGGKVQNSYNRGEAYAGNSTLLGGVVGNNKGHIQNCFMHSTVNKGTKTSYPLYGNNVGGTVTGCFYAEGSADDALTPRPIALNDNTNNETTITSSLSSANNILLARRTLYTDGYWNTLCLPFDIPAGADGRSPIAGATVMTLDSSSLSDGTLTLNFTNVNTIEAGKPYIVKWSPEIPGNLPDPVFLGARTSSNTTDVTTEHVDFVGSCSPVTLTGGNRSLLYLGGTNTLYYPNADMTIGACRAYFRLKDGLVLDELSGGSASVRAFILNFDGKVKSTDISTHRAATAPDGIYTPDGRRLPGMPTAKGLYILNGKKIIIK